MNYRFFVLFLFSLAVCAKVTAQKPFTEGTIIYKVQLVAADKKEYKGFYIFAFKGNLIKKSLRLSNGYEDIVLYNCGTNTLYSLQNRNGKKYAIQLSMDEYQEKQEKFAGFTLNNETANQKIAGCAATKGKISYKDGTAADIIYTKEWYPAQAITFERFPDARFFPLSFSYTDEHGIYMQFEATNVNQEPVENAVFRIPPDYKIISYNEYKELSK